MKYKVSVIKKIAFLVMTMALAVAMVACSGAVGKPGPEGPKGDPGGEPAGTPDPGDPTTTLGPMPVQIVEQIGSLAFTFNDDAKKKIDSDPRMIMLAGKHVYPSTGVMYELVEPSSMVSDMVDAKVDGSTGELTVMLKEAAKYEANQLKVKASNDINSTELSFMVRRNRPPRVAMVYGTGTPPEDSRLPIEDVWVGTMEPKELAVTTDCKLADAGKKCISVHIGASAPDALEIAVANSPFFHDDPGDKLELVPERLSASNAKRLMVEGGSTVTLMGKDTTFVTNDSGTDTNAVTVSFRAVDANGLESEDAVEAIVVRVDKAPSVTKKIGTRLITIGQDGTRMSTVMAIAEYFTDDRLAATLEYLTMSDNPEIAILDLNGATTAGGEHDKSEFKAISVADLVIIGVNPGEAMITVRAVETLDTNGAARADTGGLKQTVDQTFKVVVQLD